MNNSFRDKGNGQYSLSGGWGRLCRCGHTLGKHAAETANGERPCFAPDDGVTECSCIKFKHAKKATAA